MRVLLDTNILIHREAPVVVEEDIGILFNWLDRLNHEKCVHPASLEEIEKHENERVRNSFLTKLDAYSVIKVPAPLHEDAESLSTKLDRSENDRVDTRLVNELLSNRVDLLISEDRGIHDKAERLGIPDRVFTIDAFLEKVTAENPELAEYGVLSVRKELFGHIDVEDTFFDSFREDYPGFNSWFNRKSDKPAYVCRDKDGQVVAFLYLKVEREDEPYHNIEPVFQPAKRLKIGTLKVELNGFKIGERFLKIVFDNAINQGVDEIYVTIFRRTMGQERLIKLLEDFGFERHGCKHNDYGTEEVYVRGMTPSFDASAPKRTFPFVSTSARSFLVPIYPKYHTELLPDSILNTESPDDFVEHEPHRNAIRKVYVSRSYNRDVRSGDVIVFYRTKSGGSAYYTSVVTTLGIVDQVYRNIESEEQFIRLCRKRSVFTDNELREHWNYRSHNRPFIVEFLYAYSFPKRPNLKALIDHGVIPDTDSAPRGFERISDCQLSAILSLSQTDPSIVID